MIDLRSKRVILGVCVLIIVNIVWVLSSELTNYIFVSENFTKPFLTTYIKSSLFSVLLCGFLCSAHWRMLAFPQRYFYNTFCVNIQHNNTENIIDKDGETDKTLLSEPTYIPINYESEENPDSPEDDYILVNQQEKEEDTSSDSPKRTVQFCKYKEVRHLSETYAEESLAARMSYSASKSLKKRMMIRKIIEQGFYPATQVMKLAIQFCFCWFIASYAYQKSLSTTLPAVVNVISSTSSLFTLILASIFPSSEKDKFSITKLFVVCLSMAGVVLINFSMSIEGSKFRYEGIIWSIIGALGYAIYLVNLRRNVKDENQMSLPMFLGFVGLWTVITLWPGFVILTWTDYEKFEIPNKIQFGSILLNGILGTVGAELLWLWGCFLTSSLTATLSMGLTIPLSMLADFIIKKKVYNWIFYLGSIPILVSFIAVAYLTSGDGPSPDPLGKLCHKVFCMFSKTTKYSPLLENDSDMEVEHGHLDNDADNNNIINGGDSDMEVTDNNGLDSPLLPLPLPLLLAENTSVKNGESYLNENIKKRDCKQLLINDSEYN